MSLVDKLLRRKKPDGPAEVDLAALAAHLISETARLEAADPEPDLMRARLADACRDAGLDPADPDDFAARTAPLDADGRRRLALAVGACEVPAVRDVLPRLGTGPEVSAKVAALAAELPLLTAGLLRQSGLRAEEFARQFAARLGAGVKGETPEQSRARLDRLDYGRLLAEAESAKQAAEGRMTELRKRQAAEEARRTRRGKW